MLCLSVFWLGSGCVYFVVWLVLSLFKAGLFPCLAIVGKIGLLPLLRLIMRLAEPLPVCNVVAFPN